MRISVTEPGWFVLLVLFGIAGCGDDAEAGESAVPIEDIPDDKRIVDLSEGERKGVCEWADSVAQGELPPPGTMIDCGGVQIRMNAPACNVPTGSLSGCEATLAEYKVCLPALMSRIGDDPCQLLDIMTDADALEFVESTPGCAGLGPCATAL